MALPPRVAVILVNHQDYTRPYLAACYASLMAQTYPADRVTLFIVNNGLPEAETRLTEQLAPTARMLQLPENVGWGGGNNAAIRVALAERFDYIILLNIDVTVDRAWLTQLVEEAERRPDTHILQSLILLHGTNRINSLGNRIQFLGFGYCQGYGEPASGASAPEVVDYASGASMLVRREVFEAVGMFRDDYFMYYDDVEFCWRARLAGYAVGVATSSVCRHKYAFATTLQWLYHLDRNRLTTLLTLERPGTLALILPCLLVAEGLLTAYYLCRGWGGSRLKLLGYFLRAGTWSAIRRNRLAIRRIRTRRDADIVKHFAAPITFAEVDGPVIRYVMNPLLRLYWGLVRSLIFW
ncbi:MAG: glycosyltransferase family 2 protein [Candidatus Omnitrophica bacterium]|nr:glycosyltransferase family 2 protein [Candidatus Omnitrophota bacterium]